MRQEKDEALETLYFNYFFLVSFCNFLSLAYDSASLILGLVGAYSTRQSRQLICDPGSFVLWKLVALCACELGEHVV